MVFVLIATLCSKQWPAFTTFVPVKKYIRLIEEDIKRDSRKRELDELRRDYMQEKGFTVFELWVCEWWRLYKQLLLINCISEKTSLTDDHLQNTNS